MGWRVDVDGDTCIGSGMCVGMAAEHFELSDGTSRPVRSEIAPSDDVVDAAESCPVEAITVRDVASGRTVAPE